MTTYDTHNIFAKILRCEIPCYKVYENRHTLTFLDIKPRSPGHALAIPKIAARGILDITEDDFAKVARTAKKIAVAAVKAFGAEGSSFSSSRRNSAASESKRRHEDAHHRTWRLEFDPGPGSWTGSVGSLAPDGRPVRSRAPNSDPVREMRPAQIGSSGSKMWTFAAPERPERSALASSEQILDAHSERGRNLVQGFDCGIRRFDFDGAHEHLSDAGPGRQLGLRPSALLAKSPQTESQSSGTNLRPPALNRGANGRTTAGNFA
jgi:hypothetical protein